MQESKELYQPGDENTKSERTGKESQSKSFPVTLLLFATTIYEGVPESPRDADKRKYCEAGSDRAAVAKVVRAPTRIDGQCGGCNAMPMTAVIV